MYNMKHVDPNMVSLDRNGVTVDGNNTGFLVLKYICLSMDTQPRDVKICLIKDGSIVQTFTVRINVLDSVHVNKIYRFNEPEQRHIHLKISDFVNYESANKLTFICDNNKVSLGMNKDGNLSVSLLTKKAPHVDAFTIFI